MTYRLVQKLNKRGSVTVFLMIFLTSLVACIMVFVSAAGEEAVWGAGEGIANMAAGAVMAEYDIDLFKRYGLFGFYADPDETEKKLDFYGSYPFEEKKYAEYEGSDAILYDYSLDNIAVFRKQVIKAGKMAAADQIIFPKNEIMDSDEPVSLGMINNGVVKESLPSKGFDTGFSIKNCAETMKKYKDADSIIKTASDAAFINSYIDGYFRNFQDGKDLGDTFFQGEEEYILCGGLSDKKNERKTKLIITGVREIMNDIYIHKCPEKMTAVSAVAALVPPPGNIAAEEAIIAAWALAESINDYRLLKDGKKVPFMKDKDSWAVDLSLVTDGYVSEDGSVKYIDTGSEKGNTYGEYMKVFLIMTDERTKLLRTMDLVQINMKYLYNRDFLMSEYHGGLEFTMKINGKYHTVIDEY